MAPSRFRFAQHGKSGAWLSELLPHTAGVADELCFVRSMFTEAINHGPGVTFLQTGTQIAGRPSFGAWLSYGLGSETQALPAYVVLTSFGSGRPDDQPLYDRLWGSGFLPSRHQGVKFRNKGDAVLYLSNPKGVDAETQRASLDTLGKLNEMHLQKAGGDRELEASIQAAESAFPIARSVQASSDPDVISGAYKSFVTEFPPIQRGDCDSIGKNLWRTRLVSDAVFRQRDGVYENFAQNRFQRFWFINVVLRSGKLSSNEERLAILVGPMRLPDNLVYDSAGRVVPKP